NHCSADGRVRVEFQLVRTPARFPGPNGYAAGARRLRDRLADLGKSPDAKPVDAARSHHLLSSFERRDVNQRPDRLCVFIAGPCRVRMAPPKIEHAGFGVVGMDAVAS